MAGDPLYDVTPVYIKGQVWYDTSTPTDATYPSGYYRYTVVSTARTNEEDKEKKRRKWFLQQAMILAMKEQWNEKIVIKPDPILKPSIQLRGVCFGGRGWA